jgi:hypothetical protein
MYKKMVLETWSFGKVKHGYMRELINNSTLLFLKKAEKNLAVTVADVSEIDTDSSTLKTLKVNCRFGVNDGY